MGSAGHSDDGIGGPRPCVNCDGGAAATDTGSGFEVDTLGPQTDRPAPDGLESGGDDDADRRNSIGDHADVHGELLAPGEELTSPIQGVDEDEIAVGCVVRGTA